MEELNLNLIRVASYPGSIFEFYIIHKVGNATGMVGVYSYDDDWYYLYKKDTDKYKVKRRKDLEGIKPSFTYKQQRNNITPYIYEQKGRNKNDSKVAENGGSFIMDNIRTCDKIQKHFGDKFIATETMSRFEVMIDHFSKKFSLSSEQVQEAYEKTLKLHDEGKVEKFSGYLAAICKGMSNKEYSPEQTQRYIEYNIHQRKDEQLLDFIQKYENGERRVFAPHFGITKKEHNQLAYETAKHELDSRRPELSAPDKSHLHTLVNS